MSDPSSATSASLRLRGERFVLAVDLGTGGPKVGFVSLAGRIAWQEHLLVTTRRLPGGGAVQDAEAWWRLIADAARRGLASGAVAPGAVAAVSCTAQWASIVPVDAEGRPVGDCIMWQDTRGARHARRVVGGPLAGYAPLRLWQWVRRTGGAPSPSGNDPISHMLHLAHDQPEVARAARWYLEPADYLTMRFTGAASASHATMIASWLTDNRRQDVLAYDPTLVRIAGVDANKLPPLRPTVSVVGVVRDDVAAALGLPRGVPVVAGTPDLHSAAVGSGAVRDFETHMAVSTTAWIGLPVPFKKSDLFRAIVSVPGLRADRYLVANNHDTGGMCLRWLRENILGDGVGYDELTALAAGSAPGSGGVLFTPWLAGERSPVTDRRARAGFHNLSLATTRADVVRAVMEGVAYNNRWLHEAVERFAGRRLDPVRMIGGGALSDLWCQIHADAMNRTIERPAEPLHTNLRGAALIAALAIGAVREDEVRTLVPAERTFAPDPANRAVYDRLYGEFPRLYRRQRAMFRRLNGPS
ncbi:FGGY-family carbohydrate kinase [bacterium]|nr:FGGY-family carbohydrate kinase [bacterium]